MPGDKETELSDANLLGDASFDNFWSGQGLKVLMRLVDKQPEMLPSVVIKTDTNKSITIDEFLTSLNGLKIRY
tara:strand:+ start:116 stop:334 length:219 start_codon:yes stop_codon:yes gene_type:complete